MPIDIERFEGREVSSDSEPTQPRRVLRFLAENDDRAFKATEVADAVDVPENSIWPVLSRLKERRLVRNRDGYWAITDDRDRLRNVGRYGDLTAYLNDKLGAEDEDAWADAAADPDDRPERSQ